MAADELANFIHRLVGPLAHFSDRLPFPLRPQNLPSVVALAALAVAWKLLSPPPDRRRPQRKRPGPSPSRSASASQACSSGDSGLHDVVDDFFQPAKLTLGQLVRLKLCEGRKVTCRLLGVILGD